MRTSASNMVSQFVKIDLGNTPGPIFTNQKRIATMECSICYEAITAQTGQAALSCSHTFHIACIMNSMLIGHTFTCPYCRHALGPLEIPEFAALGTETDADESIAEVEEDPVLESLVRGNAALMPYMWAHMNRTGVDPYAAFTKLWTSILTVQSVWRSHAARQALRHQALRNQL